MRTSGTITSLTNQAGGWLKGDNFGAGIVIDAGGRVGTLVNSGSATGWRGLNTNGAITTLTNSGTFAGVYEGVGLGVAASVSSFTNSGVVSGGGDWGMYADTGSTLGTLTNSGTFTGYNGIVSYAVSGTISNLAGGLIAGPGNRGLGQYGTLTRLENAGSITGVTALLTAANIGTVENQAGGSIAGTSWGIFHDSGTLGTLTNMASGTISGNASGLGIVASTGTISNAGLLQGGQNALRMGGAGSVALFSNSGTATGASRGFWIEAGTLTNVENSGRVAGGNAFENYGTITSLTNSGVVAGTNTWGIYSHNGSTIGTLTNTASGTISGATYAIGILGGSGTIANAGHIQGSTDSVYVGSAGTVALLSNTGTAAGRIRSYGTITAVENAGRIAGNHAIENYGTITSLTNSGVVAGNNDWGIYTHSTGLIGTLTNTVTGTISGGTNGIGVYGPTGTISNAGLLQGNTGYGVFVNNGVLTQLTNTGVVTGGQRAVHAEGGSARIGTITNSGTMQGGEWGLVLAVTGTINNTASGVIRSTGGAGQSAMYLYSTTGLLSNAGLIDGKTYGIWQAGGSTTALTNSGTITGSTRGVSQNGGIATLTNTATGLIDSPNGDGIFIGTFDDMDVVNAGRITGGRSGVYAWYGIDNLTNQSGGVISGTTGAGVYIENQSGTVTNQAGGVISSASNAGVFVGNNSYGARLTTLSNAGSIEGVTAGVHITDGTIRKLTNTGTVAYTGAGTGPAVLVGPGGVLGVASGTAGPAIESTGAGALLDGIIVNQGTIHHGFTIANQNVTVSAGGGSGTFTNGLLDVVGGNLTFIDGTTTLGADISVTGGAGTVFNQGTLRLLDVEQLTGSFQQGSTGTLLMALFGTSSGQYGQFDITGSGSFSGTLALDDTGLSGGLTDGQIFQLFEFGSYSGGFGSLAVNGVSLSGLGGGVWSYGGLLLTEQWTTSTMSLVVTTALVPEIDPAGMGSALALVFGGLGLFERRRRRA